VTTLIQRLGATVGYLNKGYPRSTIKKDKPLRKPRQGLRPRRRDEPKPRTECLDHVPTRTRLARRDASTIGKSLTRTTLGRAGRPTSLTNSETKVKAFNATANHLLPPWIQRYRHGSSTSVKSHFLLTILEWAVKTYHYTRHVGHCFVTDPPRGRIRRVSYPEIPRVRPYPFLVDPPRPGLDPASSNYQSTKKQGLHATGSGFFSLSHPLRHHGVRGWPTILGIRRYNDFHNTRQNFISKASPDVSASSRPYKRAGMGLCEGGQIRRNKSSPHRRRSTYQEISFVLSL
jgi:hypothetical protein